jgi:hypothetical protein
MNAGSDLKQGFNMLMAQFGEPIVVRRGLGTDNESSATLRGMKNNEKNNVSKVMFQFSDPVDVRVGDVLQQEKARELWEVYEIEDNVIGGTFINLTARVQKAGGPGGGPTWEGGKSGQRSGTHQVVNIQKFTGVFGNVTNSNVSLYDYSSIHQLLKERSIPQEQRNELENILDELRTAAPEKKKSLLERGMAWVSQHKDFLGDTAEIVRKALGA